MSQELVARQAGLVPSLGSILALGTGPVANFLFASVSLPGQWEDGFTV